MVSVLGSRCLDGRVSWYCPSTWSRAPSGSCSGSRALLAWHPGGTGTAQGVPALVGTAGTCMAGDHGAWVWLIHHQEFSVVTFISGREQF